jgi:phage-related protein
LFEVEFYEDTSGKEPVKDFIKELQAKGQTSKADRVRVNKLLTYIRVLQTHGTRAGEPYTKHIDGDIWELRPFNDRVFFFYFKNNTYILLHHFVKKTRKTPPNEIDHAKRNMLDHIERSKHDGK